MFSVVLRLMLGLAAVWAALVAGARMVGEWLPPAELLAYTNSTVNNTLQVLDFSIFLLDAGRGLNVKFIGGAVEPAWSPDGRELAFLSAHEGSSAIYISDLSNPSPRRLTYTGMGVAALTWSPTGEWIAYSTQTMSDARFYLVNLETKNTLGYTGFQTRIDWLTWSPDGKYLIGYGSYPSRASISGALFMVNVEDGSLSYVGADVYADLLYCEYTSASWAVDSQRIAAGQRCGEIDILSILNVVDGSWHPLLESTSFDDSHPVWSSDGEYIAYISWDENNTQLNLVRPDGTEQHVLVSLSGGIYDFQWIPNRDEIVFLWFRMGNDRGWGLSTVDVHSGSIRQLMFNEVLRSLEDFSFASFDWRP